MTGQFFFETWHRSMAAHVLRSLCYSHVTGRTAHFLKYPRATGGLVTGGTGIDGHHPETFIHRPIREFSCHCPVAAYLSLNFVMVSSPPDDWLTPDGHRLHSWPRQWFSKNRTAAWNHQDSADASLSQGASCICDRSIKSQLSLVNMTSKLSLSGSTISYSPIGPSLNSFVEPDSWIFSVI